MCYTITTKKQAKTLKKNFKKRKKNLSKKFFPPLSYCKENNNNFIHRSEKKHDYNSFFLASKKAQQKLTRIFLFLFLINFLRAPSSATSPPDIKKKFPPPPKNFEKYYVSEWERAEQRKKIYLKKFELNAAWMYCKILAWEKSTQNERRLQRQLDHVQNPECFVFEKNHHHSF